MMKRLAGTSALITGAARGIGRTFAEAFTREGAIVAVADMDSARARKTAAEIGGGTYSVSMDVTDIRSIKAAVREVEERSGRIDIQMHSSQDTRAGQSAKRNVWQLRRFPTAGWDARRIWSGWQSSWPERKANMSSPRPTMSMAAIG
jgi:NAD(P)-dependent dehydrogenase (short-subunit alcohol dehydrogenase family)